MGKLIRHTEGNYTNTDAVENVIRYVTRTRVDENSAEECVGIGGRGVSCYWNAEIMIRQFQYIQNVFGIQYRGGRRMYHETFSINILEFYELGANWRVLYQAVLTMSSWYYQRGHQVVFAIHNSNEKGPHIHFAVNTINFCTGRKWHDSMMDLAMRENEFNNILEMYKAWFREHCQKAQSN